MNLGERVKENPAHTDKGKEIMRAGEIGNGDKTIYVITQSVS